MKTVRDACQLQPNALSIKLSDQIEQLDQLITDAGDGTEFFEKTKITHGMEDLISEGIARLARASAQAFFHLKQAMGGGKTHLLVGFGLLANTQNFARHIAEERSTGPRSEAREPPNSTDATTRTISFGARSPANSARASSSDPSGPTGPKHPTKRTGLFDGGEPILILFDEMPPYFHYLDTQKVGNGTVADIATRAFANLLTAAGKKSNVCVVVSDLAATYDTGTRLINRALEDARQELGRQERNIIRAAAASATAVRHYFIAEGRFSRPPR